MNICCGLQYETFKLVCGNDSRSNAKSFDGFPKELNIAALKNSFAAFQILVRSDEDYALNVGNSPWISQNAWQKTLRIQIDAPFCAEMHIIGMHTDDDGLRKGDALLAAPVLELRRGEARAVWAELKIPANAATGSYSCKIRLFSGCGVEDEVLTGEMHVTAEVLDFAAPEGEDNRFHLDLWQHPSNIARKHEVPLWSDAHFAVLEAYVRSLGELGQKAVTLPVAEIPWSGQDCHLEHRMRANLYEYSIIPVAKETDGSFTYDYSLMQRYIDLCARYGIDRELSLYGLCEPFLAPDAGLGKIVPEYASGVKIRYLDKQDGSYKYMRSAAELDGYIQALEQYFSATGQLEKVRLAADEPGDMENYRKAVGHIRNIAPGFRFKAAIHHAEFIGEFGEEISDFAPLITGMCQEYDTLKAYQRQLKGKRFLWYVCCGPRFPNTFLVSDLLECWLIGILTSYAGLDGFLRWGYTAWNDAPRADVRYGNWRAGDTCLVYPSANGGPLLTLRYKALKRGIELYGLLEQLKKTQDEKTIAQVFACVLREKDIRSFYQDEKTPIDCSMKYEDYTALMRMAVEKIGQATGSDVNIRHE